MTPLPPGSHIPDAAALQVLWSSMMGDGGFGGRSLWVVFLDADDRTTRVVMPIDDLPVEPDLEFIGSFGRIVGDLLAEGRAASIAMLLTRPGPPAMQGSDRRWAAALIAGLPPALLRWPLHLATRGTVRTFAPDDLVDLAS